jgi:hypothetical protein
VNAAYIDFISSYCDRWCERCRFTDRCSAFACEVAIGMCGDVKDGIELAVGSPPSVDHDASGCGPGGWLFQEAPTAEELAQVAGEEDQRDVRLEASAITVLSNAYRDYAAAWLESQRPLTENHADAIVREAFEIICWDVYFIGAKVHRALDGLDRAQHGEKAFDENPIQNDWNGSAKIALISIERSTASWIVVSNAMNDTRGTLLASVLERLREALMEAFPAAMSFIRPGFDEAK